jgi:hypothetical protein
VWHQPNLPPGFDPDKEVWRETEVDGSQTLTEFQ